MRATGWPARASPNERSGLVGRRARRPRAKGMAGAGHFSPAGGSTVVVTLVVDTAEPTRARSHRRLAGIDVARALAFGGMLTAHYAFPRDAAEPGWLRGADAVADGRAAPLFCVVLGIGAGFLAARGTRDRTFVVRGLALLLVGLAIWPYQSTVYLILPHYGLLLALVPIWRRIPTPWLLPLAAVAFLLPTAVTALMDDHLMRSADQPDSYEAMGDWWGMGRNLLWTGGYPLVGWVGFVLLGLWLARQRLGDRLVQLSLLLAGIVVMLAQPLLATAAVELGGLGASASTGTGAGGLASFFDGTAHSNRTAWYVLSSGTAVAVLAACLLVTSVASGARLLRPLVHLGQLALTAYLVHLVIGEQVIWDWQDRSEPSLTTQLLVAGAIYAALAVFATLWRSRFRRGPVEGLLRLVAR
ncbi:MAG: DUF418 domain-containing protein [Acidimicrobiia bacterium]|nr:DUF418 domain-containing protein [Acidimicrobiia bacterium]